MMTIKIFRQTILSLIAVSALFLFSLNLVQAAGTYSFTNDSGLEASANTAGFSTGNDAPTVDSVVGNVIYILLSLVGVIFLAFIMYGGITWMTAQGNEEKVKKANKILMNSLFGLIITLSAYIISYFLINTLWQ